jgi:hypothetical protein
VNGPQSPHVYSYDGTAPSRNPFSGKYCLGKGWSMTCVPGGQRHCRQVRRLPAEARDSSAHSCASTSKSRPSACAR